MAKNGKKKGKVIIFSGVRQLAGLAQYPYVRDVVVALRGRVFITGGAPGIDTLACVEAVRHFPKARHICVVPYGYKIQDVHLSWCESNGVEILDMPKPKGADANKPQRWPILRNEYMIKLGNKIAKELDTKAELVAFPGGPDEVQRSGTWTTIRRARAADTPVRLYPLSEADGSIIGGKVEE